MSDGYIAEGRIEPVHFAHALSERYLAYALSTIMSRSLPDVRDGLKPVHRRLLYAMQQLKLDPSSGFKKCARVVGDVIGKYHPHGDASVYEALVRLAQDFAVRYPLIEGQGNFGSIDGDNPAAMRYTESRMTEVARALLAGIEEDAVDFRPTYDGEEQEPVVLPGAFPNLLANGAAGIAVGMATSIPPHNAAELCEAAIHLIRNPSLKTCDLLQFILGPDFPTGAVIVEGPDVMAQAYETGRGGFRVRARWEVEQGRFGTWQIVVTEIPYQVQKSRLIEQIASLLEQKKLPLLADIRDESTTDIRLVLEPKVRTTEPHILMETLFRQTALESRFPLNMNVLGADGTPAVMNLKQVLQAWLEHRHSVLIRRSTHRLDQVQRRLEILDGFLAVYLNLDEVIRIIREEDEPRPALMQAFSLTELQADSILNMRLRSLRRLEEEEIRKEHAKLSQENLQLQGLLKDEKARWQAIEKEIRDIKKKFGSGEPGKRRTTLGAAPAVIDIPLEGEVEREAITVILSQQGWVKAIRGHGLDTGGQKFKEGDAFRFSLECHTTDRLCFFGTDGRAFTVKASDIPRGRGDGQPFRLLAGVAEGHDILTVFPIQNNARRLVFSNSGRGFIIRDENIFAETRRGKQILTLKPGERAAGCLEAAGDYVAILGQNRKFLVFELEQIPEMSKGLGVQLQKYREQGPLAQVHEARIFSSETGLIWPDGSRPRPLSDLHPCVGKRADTGKTAPLWTWRAASKRP